MSCVSKLALKFTDTVALARAVGRCGGEVLDLLKAKDKGTFRISRHISIDIGEVGLAFTLQKRRFPFVAKTDGTLVTESSNRADSEQADLTALNFEYTKSITENYCESQGWACVEETAENGERQLAVMVPD